MGAVHLEDRKRFIGWPKNKREAGKSQSTSNDDRPAPKKAGKLLCIFL
jgi:hypothetical protein